MINTQSGSLSETNLIGVVIKLFSELVVGTSLRLAQGGAALAENRG